MHSSCASSVRCSCIGWQRDLLKHPGKAVIVICSMGDSDPGGWEVIEGNRCLYTLKQAVIGY